MRFRSLVLMSFAFPLASAASCADDEATRNQPGADASLEAGRVDAPASDAIDPLPQDGGSDGASDGADALALDAADATDASPDVTPKPGDIFVNASTGSDANSGAEGQPFKTLTKAMSVAVSGKVVWLEDGEWTSAVDAPLGVVNAAAPCSGTGVVVPAGVSVRALNAGAAKIAVSGVYGLCVEGGGTIAGVRFERTSGGVLLVLRGGTSALVGVSLGGTSAVSPTLRVINGTKATWSANGVATYISGQGPAVEVDGAGSELVVNGGAFDDAFQAGAHLTVSTGAKLVLNGVKVERPAANQNLVGHDAIFVGAGSTLEVRGASLIKGFNSGSAIAAAYGSTVLVTDTTKIEGNQFAIFATSGGTVAPANVTLSGAVVMRTNSNGAIFGDSINGHQLQLTVTGSVTIADNGNTGIHFTKGTLTMTGGTVSNNGANGILTAATPISMRNVTLTGNAATGIYIAGTGSADLGTKASPGNNIIQGNATANGHNLRTDRNGITAVGNTWDANIQGADAMGRFSAPTDGGIVELTAPVIPAGKNFFLTQTGHKLLLAE